MAVYRNARGRGQLIMTELPLVLLRADASVQIGTGHVMRCLTLADALQQAGYDCLFLCRPHAGHLIALIAARGHQVISLPTLTAGAAAPDSAPNHAAWLGTSQDQDAADCLKAIAGLPQAAWLVADHYALDQRWQRQLRHAARRVLVLDDLADRAHDCDLLLDPGIGRSRADYAALIPAEARVLSGPEHALLRPEFAVTRPASLARRQDPQLRRLLITLGGVDKDNITRAVLDALDQAALPADLTITVVMGPHAPWLSDVTARACSMSRSTRVLTGVRDMARLMCESDLAIGAAGSTAWERCCLGLPTIQLVLAENQTGIAAALAATGSALTVTEAARIADLLQASPPLTAQLAAMSAAAARLTAGRGTAFALAMMETMDG